MDYAGETTNDFLHLWLSHLVAMYLWEILFSIAFLESHQLAMFSSLFVR